VLCDIHSHSNSERLISGWRLLALLEPLLHEWEFVSVDE
jgi:hypothetical protein